MSCPHEPPPIEPSRKLVKKDLIDKDPLEGLRTSSVVENVARFYFESFNKWSIDDTHEISCIEVSIRSLWDFQNFVKSVFARTRDPGKYISSDRDPGLLRYINDTLRELLSDIRMQLNYAIQTRDRLEAKSRFDRQTLISYLQIGAGIVTLVIAILSFVFVLAG